MTHSRLPLFLILVLTGLTACSTTRPLSHAAESADMGVFVSDVLDHMNQHGAGSLLVVFDIDNTLLAMEQGLGSDQWYEWQKEQSAHDACDPRVVGNRLAVQGALYFASAMRPTQADAAAQVKALQDAGVPVIALTSRGTEFRLQTFRELRRSGFDMRRTALPPPAGWPENFIPQGGSRLARYEDGVFLTAGQHKGLMLRALLERSGVERPRVVFMLDDKQGNLDAIEETMAEMGIPTRVWRYTREDPNVTAFDAGLSDHMWRQAVEALISLEQVFGPDHYSLEGAITPAGCENPG